MTDHAAPLRAPLLAIAGDAALPRDLRVLAADAHDAADVEAVAARAAKVLVAVEDYESHAEAISKKMREALLTVLEDIGAPTLDIGSHLIGTSTRKSVHVDEAVLPAEFWSAPKPKPDTTLIRAAIDKGETPPGCTLGNGVPSLFIRAKRK
jgi:uncharacterized protein (UPF0147 family)